MGTRQKQIGCIFQHSVIVIFTDLGRNFFMALSIGTWLYFVITIPVFSPHRSELKSSLISLITNWSPGRETFRSAPVGMVRLEEFVFTFRKMCPLYSSLFTVSRRWINESLEFDEIYSRLINGFYLIPVGMLFHHENIVVVDSLPVEFEVFLVHGLPFGNSKRNRMAGISFTVYMEFFIGMETVQGSFAVTQMKFSQIFIFFLERPI